MSRLVPALLGLLGLLLSALPAGAAQYHVTDGQPADPGEYPSFTAVVLRSDSSFAPFCGGTLIGPSHVLTAAHCVRRAVGGTLDSRQISTMTGTSHLQDDQRPLVDVTRVVVHPHYGDGAIRDVNDIAILELAQPVEAPVQLLATTSATAGPDRPATVIGFGATEPRGSSESASPQLLEAFPPTRSDASCQSDYPGKVDPARMVCADDPTDDESDPGPDSCQGDSGGPLLDDATGEQTGVVSFGGRCGIATPGVYTEVAAYTEWIQGVLAGGDGTTDPPNDVTAEPPPPVDGAQRLAPTPTTTGPDLAEAVIAADFAATGATGAVVARGDVFADALGGSGLLAGTAPVAYTQPDGTLSSSTLQSLVDVLPAGAPVDVLGGPAAVPQAALDQLAGVGLAPRRLEGPTRVHTAIAVAREVVARYGGTSGGQPAPAEGSVLVVRDDDWADAVTAGAIAARFHIPVLVTPRTGLHPDVAAYLSELSLVNPALLVGGEAALSPEVADAVAQVTGLDPIRLAGPTRFETAAGVAEFTRFLAGLRDEAVGAVVVTNLRRPDAWSHVLAGAGIAGRELGVFAPVEGEVGDAYVARVGAAVCELDGRRLVVMGGTDVVADAPVQATAEAMAATCTDGPPRVLADRTWISPTG